MWQRGIGGGDANGSECSAGICLFRAFIFIFLNGVGIPISHICGSDVVEFFFARNARDEFSWPTAVFFAHAPHP